MPERSLTAGRGAVPGVGSGRGEAGAALLADEINSPPAAEVPLACLLGLLGACLAVADPPRASVAVRTQDSDTVTVDTYALRHTAADTSSGLVRHNEATDAPRSVRECDG